MPPPARELVPELDRTDWIQEICICLLLLPQQATKTQSSWVSIHGCSEDPKFLTRTYKLALVSLTSNPGTVIFCPDCSSLTGLASMSPFSEGSCYVTQTGFQHLGSSNPASGSHLSSFFNSHFILCICVLWPHVYPCTMCVPGACSIQKEGVSSPELEGQAVVSGPSRRTASTLTAEPSLSSLSPCPPYSP